MARVTKKGIEYFSHDVDMSADRKIKLIERKFGYTGYAVYVKLLEEIYREEGYFLKMDDEELEFLFELLDLEEVKEIISELVKRNLFDSDKYDEFGILTSERIQENYIVGTGRRKAVTMIKEYIIDEEVFEECKQDVNIKSLNVDIKEENVYIKKNNVDIKKRDVSKSTQSKQQYSKVKETKQQNSTENESTQHQKVVVDEVVLSAALKELEGRDDIRNKKAYALKMIADGWQPVKQETKKQFKGFPPEVVAIWEEYERNGCMTDKQRGSLALHREFIANGGVYEGDNK